MAGSARVRFSVLGFSDRDNVVREIYIEDTDGEDLPLAKVVLSDEGFNRDSVVREQDRFTVTIGPEFFGMETFGPYLVQRPKRAYRSYGAGTIEVIGFGVAVKLGDTERREVYKKMRDSDIAKKIAGRNGFGASVQQTEPAHEQVLQANETDWRFLTRRARIYGYDVFVERGSLHFHPPKPLHGSHTINLKVPAGSPPSSTTDFVAGSRTFLRGAKLTMTQIDPLTKEIIDESSAETPDKVQAAVGTLNWKKLVSIPGVGQPRRFITNAGHEQERVALKGMATAMSQASRYVISGWGRDSQLHGLRPRNVIAVVNAGRASGRYYVTRVIRHLHLGQEFPEAAYSVRFEVVRSGVEG